MNQIFRFLETWFGTFRAATATSKPNFKNGFQINGVDFDGDESGYLSGITPGTVTASKALVVDSDKDIGDINIATIYQLSVGKSGTFGVLYLFPTEASKGKLSIAAAPNAGDTITAIGVAEQAGPRTISIPDWSTKTTADTELSIAGIKVVANTTSRPGALGCLLYATGDNKLYVCTTASATAATWTVVGTQS